LKKTERKFSSSLFCTVTFFSLITSVPIQADPPLSGTGKYVLQPTNKFVVRLAVDLLGAHPTNQEIQDVVGGALSLDDLIDQYLDDPRFLHRLEWISNDYFLTQRTDVPFFEDAFDEDNEDEIAAALGEEPLKLFTYVVEHDLPMTDLVTADYTVANATLAAFWDIDYPGPPGGSGWLKCRYKDGRPHSGVLSMQSFYFRYGATESNKQRGRANQVTRIFLDDDHFQRNVAFELRLAANSEADLDRAIRYNLGCLACHASLEGIASHLRGFQLGPDGEEEEDKRNFNHYSPQGVERWQLINDREPAYYGRPSDGNLKTLGRYLAADPRFSFTLSKRLLAGLTQSLIDYRDRDVVLALNEIFIESGYRLKALVRAIVKTDLYRAIGVTEKGTPEDARNIHPFRMITPEQLVTVGHNLTGMVWGDNKDRPDLEYDPTFKIPAGGYDGDLIQKRGFAITPIYLLTFQRNAESIADQVYDDELRGSTPPVEDRIVFKLITGRDNPASEESAVRAQIVQWFERFYGEQVQTDDSEVTAVYNVAVQFRNDHNSNTRGWRDVLSMLLRDPRLYFY